MRSITGFAGGENDRGFVAAKTKRAEAVASGDAARIAEADEAVRKAAAVRNKVNENKLKVTDREKGDGFFAVKVYSKLEGEELTGIVDVSAVRGKNGSQHVRGRFGRGMYVRGVYEDGVLVGFAVDSETYPSLKFVKGEYRVIEWKRVDPDAKDWKTVKWITQV